MNVEYTQNFVKDLKEIKDKQLLGKIKSVILNILELFIITRLA